MAKKVAVLAVNPVNGCGLFQYLETFFENLKGHEDEFDAMVFSCGDAMEISIRPEMKIVSGQ